MQRNKFSKEICHKCHECDCGYAVVEGEYPDGLYAFCINCGADVDFDYTNLIEQEAADKASCIEG